MGIDSVAIKTFNSTGSQSVCRANDADDTKLIESEFLTKCKTEYINGSGMSFIAGTLSTLPTATTNSETYHLPSDVDAISEIILQMRFKTTTKAADTDFPVSPTLLLDLINKIEMKVGNITFQTIFPGDIYARNLTENGNLMKVEHTGVAADKLPNVSGNNQLFLDGTFFDFSVSIPFTGRNDDLRGCFLQAGAVTNSIIMKVTYNEAPPNTAAGDSDAPYESVIGASADDVSTGICVFTHQITNVEKNFLQENIVNRVVKASQGLQFTPLGGAVATAAISFTEDSKLTIDLSPVNINVSHILLNLHKGVYGKTTSLPVTSAAAQLLKDDVNDGSCWQARNGSGAVLATEVGVLKGWLKSAELVLGNDRTGNIPVSCITTNRIEQFGLTSVDNKNIYLIKLAGSAFSTAGVPFARLNNKKLILTFNALTVNPIKQNTSVALDKVTTVLNVTCCGTQVQTTVGGSISFSA